MGLALRWVDDEEGIQIPPVKHDLIATLARREKMDI